MTYRKLVGFTGSFNRPSRSRALVELVANLAIGHYSLAASIYDITNLGSSLGNARRFADLDPKAQAILREIMEADVLVVGTPTYKGSYTGLFKHAIDLIDPSALLGKPVILTATGGGDRHALIVEHQLRPLFSFFQAHALPTAVYAAERDFADYRLTAEPIRQRAQQAVAELALFLGAASAPTAIAAE
ncbi:FMN reductase [Mesorhizobium sp.]|uniref:FMN reductase n=1 Tax=Mesorhizobium sp. TaxID=1871066 RepID=UPI001227F3A2|nr:FMN reductase [Mesorhizobium sp.]TIV61852.1 MAG: FMN reductase [Mesorhizobium sp.]TKB10095.1 MAG: FMN reductase [Mesorhizobium sp.]